MPTHKSVHPFARVPVPVESTWPRTWYPCPPLVPGPPDLTGINLRINSVPHSIQDHTYRPQGWGDRGLVMADGLAHLYPVPSQREHPWE